MTTALVSPAEIDRLKAAHPADTRALVREVANRLFVAGERPTRALVRELIGRGSMTTIDAGLREWWDTLRKQFDTRIDVPGIPEQLVPAFQTALAALWQQAAVEAKGAFDDERAQAQSQIRDALAGEAAAHSMVDTLQVSLDAAQVALAERDRRLVSLDHELETANTNLATKTTALQQETAAREADRKQAETHQQAHEAAMAEVLAERTREREVLEGQLAFATRQIDEAREKSKVLASDVQRERGRAEKAEEAARDTARELAAERRARDVERIALTDEAREKAKSLASDVERERIRAEMAEEAARNAAAELADERRARDAERTAFVANERRLSVAADKSLESAAAAEKARQELANEAEQLRAALKVATSLAAGESKNNHGAKSNDG